ncbi:uncharacterized protein F5891DRAFT_981087 [Suillus fuscotomentosus]|uniref:Uncharacterized protein n=1 Tax=Suillus fuscotomentosus TaxID=1912939 RepID=A0AAD4E4T6_9AGAM|nr:uncharacterized protein F5891DRAFT_981087 [Suillus fuscotomentosus]KAG1899570.1 hypothetical protein F5891DRAFT_981087 [Suillus fuscotomentosus]
MTWDTKLPGKTTRKTPIVPEHKEYVVPGQRDAGLVLPVNVWKEMRLTELEQTTLRIPKTCWQPSYIPPINCMISYAVTVGIGGTQVLTGLVLVEEEKQIIHQTFKFDPNDLGNEEEYTSKLRFKSVFNLSAQLKESIASDREQ